MKMKPPCLMGLQAGPTRSRFLFKANAHQHKDWRCLGLWWQMQGLLNIAVEVLWGCKDPNPWSHQVSKKSWHWMPRFHPRGHLPACIAHCGAQLSKSLIVCHLLKPFHCSQRYLKQNKIHLQWYSKSKLFPCKSRIFLIIFWAPNRK